MSVFKRQSKEPTTEQLQLDSLKGTSRLDTLRKRRALLLVGCVALIGVSVGIDIANGDQEARRDREPVDVTRDGDYRSVAEEFENISEDMLPWIPSTLGIGLGMGVLITYGTSIEHEKQHQHELAQQHPVNTQ